MGVIVTEVLKNKCYYWKSNVLSENCVSLDWMSSISSCYMTDNIYEKVKKKKRTLEIINQIITCVIE